MTQANVKLVYFAWSHNTVAENEYLDSSKARRWQSVVQAIRDGGSTDDVADRIEECLHKTLRQIRKDLPLGELVRSLDDPEKLRGECDQIIGAHDVKYFLMEAANMDAELPQKLEAFVENSIDNCLHDIPWLASDGTGNFSVTVVRNAIGTARNSLQPEIERIAKKLSENPDWSARRLSRRHNSGIREDKTKSMLSESLLAGFRK